MNSLLLFKESRYLIQFRLLILTETIATHNELANIKVELENECQARQLLEAYLNIRNIVIEQLENKIKELERENAALTITHKSLIAYTEQYREQNEHDTKTINEMDIKVRN
ncbi:hypothetical protein DPMN_044405 [Dreissena polymorpha]|uniref:Uncharacterized protein n=1 Tax=Dreissena polymorpha TaxID=45954 RepID=A0A9D4D4D3_DREPO|nr:hypothetical protein DPMN_044405 [Dreissena polymorpha]